MLPETLTLFPWIVIFLTLIFLIPALLHWLWNMTIPQVFGLNRINYWQAFRLCVISFLLFGIWSID